jgi:hypothetical protein
VVWDTQICVLTSTDKSDIYPLFTLVFSNVDHTMVGEVKECEKKGMRTKSHLEGFHWKSYLKDMVLTVLILQVDKSQYRIQEKSSGLKSDL